MSQSNNATVDFKDVILRKPLTTPKGEEITVLELKEPIVLQLIDASKKPSQYEFVLSIIAAQTGIQMAVLQNMGQRDFTECADFLATFGDYSTQ